MGVGVPTGICRACAEFLSIITDETSTASKFERFTLPQGFEISVVPAGIRAADNVHRITRTIIRFGHRTIGFKSLKNNFRLRGNPDISYDAFSRNLCPAGGCAG